MASHCVYSNNFCSALFHRIPIDSAAVAIFVMENVLLLVCRVVCVCMCVCVCAEGREAGGKLLMSGSINVAAGSILVGNERATFRVAGC